MEVLRSRVIATLMALGLGIATAALRADAAGAHDIGRGWTLTGGADKTCIKSNGRYDDHESAHFGVRFEWTVNIGVDRVCSTQTVVKRYRLKGRAMTSNGSICWSTGWQTGNQAQASLYVEPVRSLCGAGTYRFETYGQLTDGGGASHGTPFEFGSHQVSRK